MDSAGQRGRSITRPTIPPRQAPSHRVHQSGAHSRARHTIKGTDVHQIKGLRTHPPTLLPDRAVPRCRRLAEAVDGRVGALQITAAGDASTDGQAFDFTREKMSEGKETDLSSRNTGSSATQTAKRHQ